jgi:hypothetical protein
MKIPLPLIIACACLALTGAARADAINYKTDALACTFTKDCGPGNEKTISGNTVSNSKCRSVQYNLTWAPDTNSLSFRGKTYAPAYVEKRRKSLSLGFVVNGEHLNFSAGNQDPTIRFRAAPKGSSPITRMLSGTCGKQD